MNSFLIFLLQTYNYHHHHIQSTLINKNSKHQNGKKKWFDLTSADLEVAFTTFISTNLFRAVESTLLSNSLLSSSRGDTADIVDGILPK